MSTVIYNCKRCKIGRRMEYNAGREKSGNYSWPFRLGEHGERIFPGRSSSGASDADCPQCGKTMSWNYLQSIKNDRVRCDARCTGARGHKCECSCSGKNHGHDWSASYSVAA